MVREGIKKKKRAPSAGAERKACRRVREKKQRNRPLFEIDKRNVNQSGKTANITKKGKWKAPTKPQTNKKKKRGSS